MMMTRAKKMVTSRWLLPVSQPVIEDGSVVVMDGRIVDLGPRKDMANKHPDIDEFRYPGVIMPGLINAHIHLELSHFSALPECAPHRNFTDWIGDLLAKRSADTINHEERFVAISLLLQDQYDSGVVLLADTGNEPFPELDHATRREWPEIRRMLEYLGPDRPGCENARQMIEDLPHDISATGHAPYSTAPELLQAIKKRCRRQGQIFSIHTAESGEEMSFLRFASGIFRDFLERRKRWDGTFAAIPDCTGTIDYFDRLGLLDEGTLLVHCIHVTDVELQLAAKRSTHICICPGSNRYLSVGKAPVMKMLEAGLLPAIGTDSPASNPRIDIWREMQLIADDHPELLPERILAMATLGGAQALHVERHYGSMATGKKARLLHLASPALLQSRSAGAVIRELVTGGRPVEITWV